MTIADEIIELFARRGEAQYGENVTMREHMLQTARCAEAEGATPALVLAGLLHDIGHLLEDIPAEIADWAADARHEEVGARWLASRFAPEIVEPVRLHVPAKRYLCAIESGYFATLSQASVYTLGLQGGPMSSAEVARFEQQPFHREAVRLRRWDDAGKVPALTTPHLEHYRALIDAGARPRS